MQTRAMSVPSETCDAALIQPPSVVQNGCWWSVLHSDGEWVTGDGDGHGDGDGLMWWF